MMGRKGANGIEYNWNDIGIIIKNNNLRFTEHYKYLNNYE